MHLVYTLYIRYFIGCQARLLLFLQPSFKVLLFTLLLFLIFLFVLIVKRDGLMLRFVIFIIDNLFTLANDIFAIEVKPSSLL